MTDQPMTPMEFDALVVEFEMTQVMTPEELIAGLDPLLSQYARYSTPINRARIHGYLLSAYCFAWEAWQAANNEGLLRNVGAYVLAKPGETAEQCRDRMRKANAEAIARACRPVEEIETGPASAVNASDSDAWELSRRECPCKDCKGRGNLPCDECGVTG